MESLAKAVESIDVFFEQHADQYVRGFPLMNSFLPSFMIALSYIAIVIIGPLIMAKREPFSLRNSLIFYNLAITLLSLYMTAEYFFAATSTPGYSLSCLAVDRNGDAHGMRLRNVSWIYFFSKIVEFCDTFFFILRKKNNQISFLHVYHHTNLVIFGWLGVKFVPTGETYFLAMFNSGVHVIMYFYYMMAAMGPQWQKYLWWKRYLTQLQLIQFVSILLHYSYIAIFNFQNCDFPRGVLIAYCCNSISFFVLFMHFYRQAYNASQKQRKMSDDSKSSAIGKQEFLKIDNLSRISPRKQD